VGRIADAKYGQNVIADLIKFPLSTLIEGLGVGWNKMTGGTALIEKRLNETGTTVDPETKKMLSEMRERGKPRGFLSDFFGGLDKKDMAQNVRGVVDQFSRIGNMVSKLRAKTKNKPIMESLFGSAQDIRASLRTPMEELRHTMGDMATLHKMFPTVITADTLSRKANALIKDSIGDMSSFGGGPEIRSQYADQSRFLQQAASQSPLDRLEVKREHRDKERNQLLKSINAILATQGIAPIELNIEYVDLKN